MTIHCNFLPHHLFFSGVFWMLMVLETMLSLEQGINAAGDHVVTGAGH